MGDSSWNPNVVNIAVSVLGSSANRLIILTGKDENLPGRWGEPSGNLAKAHIVKEQSEGKEFPTSK